MKLKSAKKRSILLFLMLIMVFMSFDKGVYASEEKQKDQIIVGTNAEYAPFEYLDDNGNITGFDYEIMESIAKLENLELVWKDMPFDSLIGSMEAGDIEVIAAGIGPTKEREKSVDFSDVYYTGSQSIICREDSDITTFEDLTGVSVAVLEGSQSDFIASGENTDYGIVEGAVVKRFKTASSAVMELKNGGVDAVLIDKIMAEIYCKQTEGIKQTPVDGTDEDSVFCIEKGNEELTERINTGLAQIKEDGTYDKIYRKYFEAEEGEVLETATDNGLIGTLKFIFLEENRWKYYVNGLKITIIVALLSVALGICIGLFTALIRLNADRKNKKTIASIIVSVYVDVIRGTPSVLQLMIIYFAVFHSNLGYVAAIVSFGINSGAYVSEVIRGGIQSVDAGQTEAGRSLGLGYVDTMRFIIIPQAVKNILPAMGNEFIQLIKETSILGYVGIVDLTKASSYVSSRTYQMFLPLVAAGIIYYIIVKLLSVLLGKFERRLRESD